MKKFKVFFILSFLLVLANITYAKGASVDFTENTPIDGATIASSESADIGVGTSGIFDEYEVIMDWNDSLKGWWGFNGIGDGEDYSGNDHEAEVKNMINLSEATATANDYYMSNDAPYAIDDDISTMWWTPDDPSSVEGGYWLKIDLGEGNEKIVTEFKAYYNDAKDISGDFYASNNDSDWTDLGSFNFIGEDTDVETWGSQLVSNSTAYRYYKLNVQNSNPGDYWVKIFELQLYEDIPDLIWTEDGKYTGAYDFNGEGGFIGVDFPFFDTETVSLWFKNSSPGVGQTIFAWSDGFNDGYYDRQIFLTEDGNIEWYIWRDSDPSVIISTDDLNLADDAWHHVVAYGDETGAKIFVDGLEKASYVGDARSLASDDSTLTIGSGGDTYFNGLIDDVQIYNRAISQNEILSLYNALSNPYQNSFSDLIGSTTYNYHAHAQSINGGVLSSEERSLNVAYPSTGVTIYESTDTEPSPDSPGSLSAQDPSLITTEDQEYLITSLSESGDGYDSQVYKVSIENNSNPKFTINWKGHGDEPEDKLVYLSVWNFNTNAWDSLASQNCASDCTLAGEVTGTKYQRDGYIWLWAKGDNDQAPISIDPESIGTDGYEIYWTTDTEGDSEAVYDIEAHDTWQEFLDSDSGYTGYLSDSEFVIEHSLNNLPLDGEDYYFMVRSTTTDDFTVTSEIQGPYTSSCPFIFSYDGSKYNFITEASSAGILSLGTNRKDWQAQPFYKDTFFPNPVSQVVIPKSALSPRGTGASAYYDIRATTELNEVNYYDQAILKVVDHSPEVNIYPDYRNIDDTIHTIRKDAPAPISVIDQDGKDVKNLIAQNDGVVWQSPRSTTPSYLEIKLADTLTTPENLKLLIKKGKEGNFFNSMPQDALQYENENGEFINVPDAYNIFRVTRPGAPASSINVSNLNGFEIKVIDLSGLQIKDNTIRLVTTNDKTSWDIDWLAVDTTPDEDLQITELSPQEATLGFHGISKYEKPYFSIGIKEPKYSETANTYIVAPLTGQATKYGEVAALLSAVDDQFVIMTQGDELSLKYSAPTEQADKERDFIMKTWDYHKPYVYGLGEKIEPLPFNDMTQYPYQENIENYPKDEEHNNYQKEYNTRLINWIGKTSEIIPNKIHRSLNTDYLSVLVSEVSVHHHTSTGSSASARYSNLLAMGKKEEATKLAEQFPNSIASVINSKFTFTKTLKYGLIDNEVKELQKFLNSHGFPLALSGPGSIGQETNKFGPLTKVALIKYQLANGIKPAIGICGPITRGFLNK